MLVRMRTFPLLLLLVAALIGGSTAFGQTPASDLRYLGSSFISMPNGSVKTGVDYITDDERSMTLYSVAPVGKLLEISGLSHLSGARKGKTVFNAKLNILEEGDFIPNVVYGIADIQKKVGSQVFYLAATKNFEVFGVTLLAGALKDPMTTVRKPFYGIEKTILPLVSLAGERFEEKNAFALKLRPYPGMSVEFGRRMTDGSDQETLYRVVYSNNF